jgi:hypothetical protein
MDFTTLTMEKQKHSHHYSDKPPYAERHVRWCERTGRELIPTFLLDFMLNKAFNVLNSMTLAFGRGN